MSGRILLVDDDRFILNALTRSLSQQGYHCTAVITAEDAWRELNQDEFDLMVLDISLPDTDGISFCRRIRAKYRLPVIMLTARDDTSSKVVGLEVGADDYITKPFEPAELIARVRAQIRRRNEYGDAPAEDRKIIIGRLVVDADARDAFLADRRAGLTEKEFELLLVLAQNANRALARDWIFEQVWGYDAELGGKTLAVFIRRLRCKIEPDPDTPQYILTVRGYGYRMISPDPDSNLAKK
jgi:two-component system response regulator VicR